MQINGKKEERLERRGQFVLARASALAASPLSSLAYSRSTVTQKKKKRLLVVFQAGSWKKKPERGMLVCDEDLGCLPFDGKFPKFRMEGKW